MDAWLSSGSTLSRAVDFKRCVRAQVTKVGNRPATTEVMRLINVGISISEDLEAAATSIKSSSDPDLPSHQQRTAFNNMFEVSTETTEAIARSLYRTVRYNSLGRSSASRLFLVRMMARPLTVLVFSSSYQRDPLS